MPSIGIAILVPAMVKNLCGGGESHIRFGVKLQISSYLQCLYRKLPATRGRGQE